MKRKIILYVVGIVAACVVCSGVHAQEASVLRPAAAPFDEHGHLINAHGAGVLFYNGLYYLFGEIKKGVTWQVPGQAWEDYRVPAGGVSCYTSRDLKNWKYDGVALPPVMGQPMNDLDSSRVIERPKVIYNAGTRKFVMWMHIDKNDYSYSRAGVAVSDRPEGPYRYLGSVQPNGQMSRDMTVYQDGDGRAYLFYSSENNNTMQVCLLSSDYLSPTAVYRRILVGRRREAPAVFRSGNKYYLISSSCTGWSPNAATFAVADHPLGPWTEKSNPCAGKGADSTFGAQSSFVLPVQGRPGHYLFMADRWNKRDLEGSDYLWLPFTMKGGRLVIRRETEPVAEWRAEVEPFAVVLTEIHVRCSGPDLKAYTFLRCYNARDRLLMEFRTGAITSVDGVMSGHYVETPPGTSYVRYGVEKDPAGEGMVYADSNDIQVQVGLHLVEATSRRGAGSDVGPEPQVDLDAYMRPFWKADTMVDETVLMLAGIGAGPNDEARKDHSGIDHAVIGRLLFTPDKILSVRNFSGDTLYKEGIDYEVIGNTIARKASSRMPFRMDSSFDTLHDLAWFNLQSQWLLVTYTHRDKWGGPVPGYKGQRLPGTMSKLRAKKPLTILAYGMSITRGLDVSGYDGVPPYMPTYVDLFARQLRKVYGYGSADRLKGNSPVLHLINAGLPGSTVEWGAQYAGQYINPVRPDLVILDFGMNDFWRVGPPQFGEQIRTIIRKVRAVNPDVEFLLLSNMQFDPSYILPSDTNKTFYETNMAGYKTVLRELEGEGIANLDMTTLSGYLYQHKRAKDCLVNPLHPNDWMARWYAQGMVAMLTHRNY